MFTHTWFINLGLVQNIDMFTVHTYNIIHDIVLLLLDDNGIYNRSDINANNSLYWRNTFITGARAMEEYLLELE